MCFLPEFIESYESNYSVSCKPGVAPQGLSCASYRATPTYMTDK